MIFSGSPSLYLVVEKIGMWVLLVLDLELDLKPVVLLLSPLLVDPHIILIGQN